jgi:undecaprenyl-diphosphatase
MVPGRGKSFPSGHPFATATSWGVLPFVVSLYTRRRGVWWAVSIMVWTLAVGVAASRVYLGVHWPSDVVGGLLLAILGVAGAERLARTHGPAPSRGSTPVDP